MSNKKTYKEAFQFTKTTQFLQFQAALKVPEAVPHLELARQ